MIPKYLWLPIVLSTSMACFGQVSQSPLANDRHDDHANWSTRASLPKILITPIHPIRDAQAFQRSVVGGAYEYEAPANSASTPFETDAEAEQLAMSFVIDHFGTLPIELATSKIQRSASGIDTPLDEADKGHTVSFKASWHGIELHESFVNVYIKGRTIFVAKLSLGNPVPLSDTTRPIISRAEAIKNWQSAVVKHFHGPEGIIPKVVTLVYVWSDTDNISRDESKEGSILAPNWSVKFSEDSDGLLVDAFNGKVWRND